MNAIPLNPNKVKAVLERSLKAWHGRQPYKYQKRITSAVIDALVDAANGETVIIPIEVPRQSGKTTAIVDLVEFLLTAYRRYFGVALSTGVFAPQREQATTDFDRLRMQFADIAPLGFKTRQEARDAEGKKVPIQFPEKWNSKTIRLYSGSGRYLGECFIFPISKQSKSESKSFGLIVIEEAQDADDDIMKNTIFPMGASTNAVRILVGTAGTKNCYFKSQLDNNPRAIRIGLDEVFANRREVYERTGDERHLAYERYVKAETAEHGEGSDYIQRQYRCKWIIGSGNFCTVEQIDAMTDTGRVSMTDYDADDEIYVGIDVAKDPDKTVCTAKRKARKGRVKMKDGEPELDRHGKEQPIPDEAKDKLIGWLTMRGVNYQEQFDSIVDWLSQFENVRAVAIDATGVGDFLPDLFAKHTSYNVIRCKFTAEFKDNLYKTLLQVIVNVLTTLPDEPMSSEYRIFRKEMLELEREYRGRLLVVHHPSRDSEGKAGHDDYPDSWALCEYADAYTQQHMPAIR